MNRIGAGSETVFLEMEMRGNCFILQCQEVGCFLQIFLQTETSEGWYTIVDDYFPVGELCAEEDELAIPFYGEKDAPAATHFRLIGVEGAWISRLLLVSKGHALQALNDIFEYESTRILSDNRKWVNLGLM